MKYLGVWEPDRIEDVAYLRDLGNAYGMNVVAFSHVDFGLLGVKFMPPNRLSVFREELTQPLGTVAIVHNSVDNRATPLVDFRHPDEPVMYVVGSMQGRQMPQDYDLAVRVELGSEDFFRLNPLVAAGIVMHDRLVKERVNA